MATPTQPSMPAPVLTTEMAIALEEKIISLLKRLPAGRRAQFISVILFKYCKGCGTERQQGDRACQCLNDE